MVECTVVKSIVLCVRRKVACGRATCVRHVVEFGALPLPPQPPQPHAATRIHTHRELAIMSVPAQRSAGPDADPRLAALSGARTLVAGAGGYLGSRHTKRCLHSCYARVLQAEMCPPRSHCSHIQLTLLQPAANHSEFLLAIFLAC